MLSMNLDEILKSVCNLTKEVGRYIKAEQKKIANLEIEIKSHNSLVTDVDKTSEKKIVNHLSSLIPDAGYITEEGTSMTQGEIYNWIIDPLDGTTNFIHGIPCYAISIALTEKNQTILGVVYEINLEECFYAIKNKPAFLNGNEISVTNTTKLANALLATGFPYYDFGKQEEYLELLGHFTKNTRGLRRLGSAATDLAYVACGRFDAFYEYGLSPWDVAAGAFIVEQAGGKVTTFSNSNDFIFGKEIVASNNLLHDEMIYSVSKYFNKTNK